MNAPFTARPELLPGITHKYKVNTSTGETVTMYITIGTHEGRPYEVFITCKNAAWYEHLNALMVIVNLALRNGVSMPDIALELMDICSPFSGHFANGELVSSLYAGIGKIFQKHLGEEIEKETKTA